MFLLALRMSQDEEERGEGSEDAENRDVAPVAFEHALDAGGDSGKQENDRGNSEQQVHGVFILSGV